MKIVCTEEEYKQLQEASKVLHGLTIEKSDEGDIRITVIEESEQQDAVVEELREGETYWGLDYEKYPGLKLLAELCEDAENFAIVQADHKQDEDHTEDVRESVLGNESQGVPEGGV